MKIKNCFFLPSLLLLGVTVFFLACSDDQDFVQEKNDQSTTNNVLNFNSTKSFNEALNLLTVASDGLRSSTAVSLLPSGESLSDQKTYIAAKFGNEWQGMKVVKE